MRFLYMSAITLTIQFVLSGCATFKVEDTAGIKSMLDNKVEAEYLAFKVKNEYAGSDKDKIIELYEKAYLSNNKWITKIQFDIQTKDTLKVGKNDYVIDEAGLTSAEFIKMSRKKFLQEVEKGLAIEIGIGKDVAEFINSIISNLIEQHNRKIQDARKRVYEELEKCKWKELK